MKEYRAGTEGTMVATRERRSGSAGGSALLAALMFSGLMVGGASVSAQQAQDEGGRPHRDVVVEGTPRAFLFELRD